MTASVTKPMRAVRPAQAAGILGVSLTTLWRWARTRPDFPKPIRLGEKTTVFNEHELDQFIASKAVL